MKRLDTRRPVRWTLTTTSAASPFACGGSDDGPAPATVAQVPVALSTTVPSRQGSAVRSAEISS